MMQKFDSQLEEMLDRMRFRQNGFYSPIVSDLHYGRIALVGLSGAGKKALYNSLWGWEVLPASTVHQTVRRLGSFSLVELPDNSQAADELLMQIEGSHVIVYVLDATVGLRPEDFQWIARLRMSSASLMIVLNKANLVAKADLIALLADLKKKLSGPVLAFDATDQKTVHEIFLPALLKVCPHLGATLAAEIGTLRRRVVNHYIRQAVMNSSTLNTEGHDVNTTSSLVEVQTKMVSQITEIYGYKSHHQNEMSLISLCNTVVRELTQDMQQSLAGLGWMTSNFINALSTWVIGQITVLHYDSEGFFWKYFKKETN